MSINNNIEEDIPNSLETSQEKEMLSGYKFYRSIGSPKLIVAPMVEHSKLAFRMMTRKYGAELCYTPMINASIFIQSEIVRKMSFSTAPEDRPLFVQLCGHDPDKMVKAAKYIVEQGNVLDAFDINLG